MEEGSLGRSMEGASDMIYDYSCSFCEDKGRNTEALFHCKQCIKNLCKSCYILHDSLFSNHAILGKDKVDQWGGQKKTVAMDTCEVHGDKEADMFCHDHDAVCCYVCISTEHRTCKLVQHIPYLAKDFRQKPEFQEMLTSVSKLQEKLNEIRHRKQSNRQHLQQVSAEVLSAVYNFRQEINEILDVLEQNTKQILDSLLKDMEKTLENDIDACQFIIDELKKILDTIQTEKMANDPSAFRAYKKFQKKSEDAERFMRAVEDAPERTLTFSPDTDIEIFLSSLDSFGVVASTEILKTTKNGSPVAVDNAVHLDKAVNVRKIAFQPESVEQLCVISGVCPLPDGNYVVTDNKNMKAMLLDDKFTIVDLCDVSPCPHDVCHIAGGEVVATLWDWTENNHELLFISTKGKLTYTKTIKLEHDCTGIAHNNGHLYVGSYDGLFVYGVAGALERKLYAGFVCRVAVSDDAKRIYITTLGTNSLITLDDNGNTLSTLHDPDLKYTYGVDVSDRGSVFVCGRDSHTILQGDRDGKKLSAITRSDGADQPWSVCFDRKKSKLVVGQISGNILVIKYNN